ncbi:MAG: TPM domain-containing protein [Azoarcus sp.]|nr:TPM domain-containing protein [Azoarcus sp.]MDD2873032.1 TPM domain-containing protein [Azoarcus sp.]MDX9837943.1 TPM domain-containing protein [Azoarcus sp.]
MNMPTRILRHFWLDADDAFRLLGKAALDRLDKRIHDSELKHTGEICLCVEASLPRAMLWRHVWRHEPITTLVRERAIDLFSTMRVWDTADNNGVLIYVQIAEHRIEIVADRGIADQLGPEQLDTVLSRVRSTFARNDYEAGLGIAIDAVDAALSERFPDADQAISTPRGNQLPNRPVVR